MSDKSNGNGWLGAVVPRRKPDAMATNPEPWAESAEAKGGLLSRHPAVKIADDYVSRITRGLAAVYEAVQNSIEANEKAYLSTSVNADAAGNATFIFNPGIGYDIDIERITSVIPPGGAGVALAVYLNEVSDASLIHITAGIAQRNTLDMGKGLYVPKGNSIVIQATGVTANAGAYIRLQISRRFIKQGGEVGSA